ncbi:alpha/beta hydrolase [Glacieibacterium sp.]|uniref:alpha/beta hydrolase n=1 Tax=Glacieibacterium sp. TaxID=2860237 RepID=UPI003AFF88C4
MKLLTLAVVALLASGAAARDLSVVSADPVAVAAHPANVVAFVMPSHGDGMNAVLYTAAGEGAHPTLLLFHGFPGNEQNLDLAQAVRRAGWNVLTLHYRGSWGSKGDFSFAHALEDAQVALDWLRDPANAEKNGIDIKRIVVGGHSMGGFMAAKVAAASVTPVKVVAPKKGEAAKPVVKPAPALRGLLLIDAWNIGSSANKFGGEGRAKALADFAENMPPLAGTSPEALVDEAVAHARDWNLIGDAKALAKLPLLDIGAARGIGADNQALAAAVAGQPGSRVMATTMPTDHSFSDHRIALIEGVVGWLQDLPK